MPVAGREGRHRQHGRLAVAERAQRGAQVAQRALRDRAEVGLRDDQHVGDLHDPGLEELQRRRPSPGCTTTATVSAASATSVSDWPDPDGLDDDDVERGAPAPARPRAWRGASPPSRSPAAIERMNTPRSAGSDSIRARSPSSAPPERREVGSTASTATRAPARPPVARSARRQQRRLAGPGRAGDAHDVAGRLAAEPRGRDLGAAAPRSPRRRAGARFSTRFSAAGAAVRSRSRSRAPSAAPAVNAQARAAVSRVALATSATMSRMICVRSKSFGV